MHVPPRGDCEALAVVGLFVYSRTVEIEQEQELAAVVHVSTSSEHER